MTRPKDYWLALAVYHEFRGVPVRKAIARGYVDLGQMPPDEQELHIRLGSLFFQGRTWVKILGHDPAGCEQRLSETERRELDRFRALRKDVGSAVIRLLDEDETLDPLVRDATLQRMDSMGFRKN